MRHVLHILISLGMWCLFGYYWYVVSGREIGASTIKALSILSIVIVVGLITTFWWVSHNKRLARRNRRTSAPPTRPETFTHDHLGRTVVAPDLALLQAAQVVDVELVPDSRAEQSDDAPERKVYSVADRGVS